MYVLLTLLPIIVLVGGPQRLQRCICIRVHASESSIPLLYCHEGGEKYIKIDAAERYLSCN